MSRIYWNKDERQLLYARMVDVIAEQRSADKMSIIRAAQEALPAERRRKVTYNMAYQYKEMVNQARTEAQHRLRDRKLTEVALQTAAPPPAGLGELFERLVDEVTKRVAAEVRKVLAEQHYQPAPSPTPSTPAAGNARERIAMLERPSSKPHRPAVLVIGLNGQQVTVTRENHSDLELSFLSAEDALGRSLIRADHTVLMTKFINHSVQCKYRHVPNLHYCNGGVTDLGNMLNMLRKESA